MIPNCTCGSRAMFHGGQVFCRGCEMRTRRFPTYDHAVHAWKAIVVAGFDRWEPIVTIPLNLMIVAMHKTAGQMHVFFTTKPSEDCAYTHWRLKPPDPT